MVDSDGRKSGDAQATERAHSEHDRLRVLSKQRRRLVLDYLDTDGSHRLPALARALVDTETATLDGVDSVRELYLELYHTDVPALSSVGLVTYDEESGALELTDAGQEFSERLDDL